jgi:hypothetical protein
VKRAMPNLRAVLIIVVPVGAVQLDNGTQYRD